MYHASRSVSACVCAGPPAYVHDNDAGSVVLCVAVLCVNNDLQLALVIGVRPDHKCCSDAHMHMAAVGLKHKIIYFHVVLSCGQQL